MKSVQSLFAEHALLPGGWAHNVLLTWDNRGVLTSVTTDAQANSDASRATGALVPSMPNLHSHAFQRAFEGQAERRTPN